MRHIKGLNVIRAFAVILVIIAHFGVWFDDNTKLTNFIHYGIIPDGTFGVYLFFVLSGFLITGILLSAKESYKHESKLVIIRNFFARRALRIFPIYYLLLFALLLAGYPGLKEHFCYYATYTSNILSYRTNTWDSYSHTWTLSVEEQFYLLWPWLIIFIRDRYLKYVFIAAIATAIISTYIAMAVQHHMAPILVFHTLDAFGLGAWYAWVRKNGTHVHTFERVIKLLSIPAIIMLYAWKMTYTLHIPFIPDPFIRQADSIIGSWLIILVVNNRSAWVDKYVLGSLPLNFIGQISYGIYLYHYPYQHYYLLINNWLYRVTAPYPWLSALAWQYQFNYFLHVAIIIAIAYASYVLIEKPLLGLKRYFRYDE